MNFARRTAKRNYDTS